ncbi:MAG: oligosaccharide flippase family protein [Granulosicoccus sp.]
MTGQNTTHSELKGHGHVERDKLGRASAYALLWSGLEQWGGQIFSLLIYVVLARLLGPEEFGLVAMAGVYIAFVQIFVNQGLGVALVQRKILDSDHSDSAFWANVCVGVLLAVLSWAFAGPVSELYDQPKLVPVIRWLSITLVLTSLTGVQVALLKRRLCFKPLAIRTLLATVVGGVIGIVLALKGFGIWSLVVQQLVSGVVRLLLLWLQSDWRPGYRFSIYAFRQLLPFSLSILGANLVEFGNRQGDKLIIGLFLGPTALGYYVLAYRLYRTMNLLLTGFISQVALSSFSAMQQDLPRLRTTFYKATRLSGFIAFPAFAFVAGVAPLAMPLLLGQQWSASVSVLQVLAIIGALECVYFFNANIMIALGKPHWKLKIGLLTAVLNITGYLILVRFGIIYVALAYVVRGFVMSPLPIYLVKKLIDIDYKQYFSGLYITIAASSVVFFLSNLIVSNLTFGESEITRLSIAAISSVVIYFFLVQLFAASIVSDMRSVSKHIFGNKFHRVSLNNMSNNVFIRLLLIILTSALIIYVLSLTLHARWKTPDWMIGDTFKKEIIELSAYDLYDLGVARIDGDEKLDLYTVNHSSRQSVFTGSDDHFYIDELGLGQDKAFPGIEAGIGVPAINSPGLYIFRLKKNLHIKEHILESRGIKLPVTLSVSLPWPIRIVESSAANVNLFTLSGSDVTGGTIYTAEILLERGGEVVITGDQDIIELPHRITIEDASLQKYFRIGYGELPANASEFDLIWRDRHSMLWHDIDGDGDSDLFIGRGGVKGQLNKVAPYVEDELLIREGVETTDITKISGLHKGNCPGRQSAWTDANADGLLDLHITCGRVAGGVFNDQLYLAKSEGGYVESASKLGLDYPGVSVFRWFDVDGDGDADLLTAQSGTLSVYMQNEHGFDKRILISDLRAKPSQIVVVDIDSDGDLDAIVVQRVSSVLLTNQHGQLISTGLETTGLPAELRSLSFADIDNDGVIDAHTVPGGIFKTNNEGFFVRTGDLDDGELTATISSARCNWYDRDLDGHMNIVCAIERYPKKEIRIWQKLVKQESNTRFWSIHGAEVNPGLNDNHWLQIDLDGGRSNPEGIGAIVTLNTASRQWTQVVGQFEGSHFSQGHYRLYFGLGKMDTVDHIEVHWPDGKTENYPIDAIDKLVKINRS